ncbi:MAG: serine/threonine-protein kinase [Acidobacteriota bacterium]|nr:serine/threonine-protein kinase [Acidobacteriota bacterium]
MGTERFRRIEEIFSQALERPREERGPFVDDACKGDDELRREVLSLLAADESASGFMDRPAVEHGVRVSQDRTKGGTVEERIGPYRLLRKIGEGGMSEVYLAVRADDEYQKRVAIKLIRQDLDREDLLRRFRMERQILAGLDHPNIATLFDGGSTDDGLPYFVMEFIEGVPIDEYCDRNALTVRERLGLFRSVCAAVQYAHQNLIVHRDIKTSNILVTQDGLPKLLDFGIAKLLNPDQFAQQAEYTATWARPMTPRYASPEQMQGGLVGTPSDVYSLGVMLYKLLTGHLPYRFEGVPVTEFGRLIIEQEPERLATAVERSETSTSSERSDSAPITLESVSRARRTPPVQLKRQLSGDLDNIVLMAIRKEPQRRYASVDQFADDVRRFLDGLPVIARKDTFGYRASRFMRRNGLAVAGVATILLLIVGFGATMAIQASRIAKERDQARVERDRATEVVKFMIEDVFEVPDPFQARGENLTALELLDRGASKTEQLNEQPEVQATLMAAIGEVYRNLGFFDRAEPLLTKALQIRRGLFGEEHLSVSDSYHGLGMLRIERGEFDEAERILRKASDVRRSLLSADDPAVIESLLDLGVVLRRAGRPAEAEEIYREARATLESDPDRLDEMAEVGNNLAAAVLDQGNFAEAEELFGEALRIRRQIMGPAHPEIAKNLSNLGVCLGMQGKYDDAEPLLREALSMSREVLPDAHPSLVENLNNLGRLLQFKGDLDAAAPLYDEAVSIQRSLVGDEHPKLAEVIVNLAALQQSRGDLALAEDLVREAIAIRRTSLGRKHSKVGFAMVRLGDILLSQERVGEAETVFREALAIHEATMPEGHWRTGTARVQLGRALAILGRYEEAEPLMLSGYEFILSQHGPDHPTTQGAIRRLVTLYETWGRPEEATRFRSLLRG